jgi:hypothetical protein
LEAVSFFPSFLFLVAVAALVLDNDLGPLSASTVTITVSLLDHDLGAFVMIAPAAVIAAIMVTFHDHDLAIATMEVAMMFASITALDDHFALLSLSRGHDRKRESYGCGSRKNKSKFSHGVLLG